MRKYYTKEEKDLILSLRPHISVTKKDYNTNTETIFTKSGDPIVDKLIKEDIIMMTPSGVKFICNGEEQFNNRYRLWLTKKGVKVKKFIENEATYLAEMANQKSNIAIIITLLSLIATILCIF